MPKTTLGAVAYHEAGHAVAALVYRVRIGREGATIVPNSAENTAGYVMTHRHFPGYISMVSITGSVRRRVEEAVMVSMAGGAAQRRFRPSSATMTWVTKFISIKS